MNRGIALFVCLAALLAHSLAIFNDGTGVVAPTYDRAYAAFRMSWQLVQEGVLRWNQTGPAFESYPSLVWCIWIALGERLQLSPNKWSQLSGMFAALVSVVLLSRFHIDRIASLIGPVLLVASGSVAAAAISGTETTTLMLAVTAAFLSFEKGWRVRLAAALVALCLIRAEGAWIAATLFALELCGARARARAGVGARIRWGAFTAAAAAVALVWIVRSATTGHVLSPLAAQILEPDAEQHRDGLVFVRDFFLSGASPLLLAVSLAGLLARRLPVTGRHALILTAVWIGLTVLRGGGALPFSELMVPVLPLVFHAVQEGLTPAVHSRRGYVRRPAIALLLAALALSALASTFPAERPRRIAELHEAWMHPTRATRPEYETSLGRVGLLDEIRRTQRLRAIGLYLRDGVDPGATVLTAWPGSIAYLSRLSTWDALGRATPRPGHRRPASWERPPRADMVAWLELEPEYVVPMLAIPGRAPTRADIASSWMRHLDDGAGDDERLAELVAALEPYELITVPVSVDSAGGADRPRTLAPYLLRRRDLELRPTLELIVRGEGFSVRVRNRGHEQLANLMVSVEDADGVRWTMRPTGEFVREGATYARANLLLYVTGQPVELVRASLAGLAAQGVRPARVRAVLLNLGCDEERDLAIVAGPAVR